MHDERTNAALFELAVDIETLQARLYVALAHMFSHVPDVRAF